MHFKKSKISSSFWGFLVAIILLIDAPGIYFRLFYTDLSTLLLNTTAVFFIFLLPIFFFRNRLKLYAWLLLPVIILGTLNMACIIFYKMPITDGIIIVTLNTNRYEFQELVRGFLLPFLIMAFSYLLVYFLFLKRAPTSIPFKNGVVISVTSLLIILSLPFFDNTEQGYSKKLRARYYSIFPISFFYSAGKVYQQYHIMNETAPIRNQFNFNAKQHKRFNEPQIHVLIIGESARRDHWGLFGYNRNTTPKLDQKKNLIPFNNIKTAGYLTEFAVPVILTGIDPTSFMNHTKQKSIISAFKESGFDTYWISNQTDYGHISIHSAESDKQYNFVLDKKRIIKNINDDAELILPLKEVLNLPGDKKFIIIKLQGSHYDYSKRYPNQFDVFNPSNKKIPTSANDYKNKNVIVNTYDNTILYTDYILDSLINLVNSKHAISSVYFISDHGEDLFDDSRYLSQHAAAEPSKYIAPIPLTIWYSDQFKNAAPEKIEFLLNNKNKKANSMNVFYTFIDLCGIQYPGFDSSKSLSNASYIEKPRFIIGGDFKMYNSDSLK